MKPICGAEHEDSSFIKKRLTAIYPINCLSGYSFEERGKLPLDTRAGKRYNVGSKS
jgi:hypothetical protein